MTRAEHLPVPVASTVSAANDNDPLAIEVRNLRDSVTASVRQYLAELDGQLSTDVYQMVLAETASIFTFWGKRRVPA